MHEFKILGSVIFFQEQLDFGSEDSHFVWFPEHEILLQKLSIARKSANITRARTYFNWRGMRDFVNPGAKTLTKLEFEKHLLNALKSIKDTSAEEKQVHYALWEKKLLRKHYSFLYFDLLVPGRKFAGQVR